MVDLDMSEYKYEFINEAKEHLQSMNEAFLDLEHDSSNVDLLNSVFRSAHTLKGSSATMGYTKVSELTHKMENVLDEIKNQRLTVTSDVFDLIFGSFDALETLVNDIDQDQESEIDVDGFVGRLIKLTEEAGEIPEEVTPEVREVKVEGITDHRPQIGLTVADKRAVDAAMGEGLKIVQVKVAVEEGCALKSVRAFMVVKKLKEKGVIVASIPSAERIEDGDFEDDFVVLLGAQDGTLDYTKLASEVAGMNEIAGAVVEALFVEAAGTPSQEQAQPAAPKKQVVESLQSVRVNVEKLDALVNLVGELVISKIRLKDIEAAYKLKDLDEAVSTVDRLVTDLRDEVMEMRMVPVKQVFNMYLMRSASHLYTCFETVSIMGWRHLICELLLESLLKGVRGLLQPVRRAML